MKYYQAINSGYGFINADDRTNFAIEGKPCDVWVVDDSLASKQWAARNEATEITQAAAEALWAAMPVDTMRMPV